MNSLQILLLKVSKYNLHREKKKKEKREKKKPNQPKPQHCYFHEFTERGALFLLTQNYHLIHMNSLSAESGYRSETSSRDFN